MKKTTRINTEMRYINNRQQFTISDLMAEFAISRSTANRDLADIQELGMPLISQVGAAGGFTVMRNQLLPAVQFNTDELKALFVSFMATTNTQLPFLQNRKTLTEKLLAIASQSQQDDLVRLKHLLRFENTNPANVDLLDLTDLASPILKTLINASLVSRHLTLTLTVGTSYDVYIHYLYHQATQWQVMALDLTTKQVHDWSLADIRTVAINEKSLDQSQIQRQLITATPTPNLILTLGPHAVQQFNRLHRPNRLLQYLDPFQQTARFQDHVDLDDPVNLAHVADWLLFLGPDVEPVQIPTKLKQLIQDRLRQWQ